MARIPPGNILAKELDFIQRVDIINGVCLHPVQRKQNIAHHRRVNAQKQLQRLGEDLQSDVNNERQDILGRAGAGRYFWPNRRLLPGWSEFNAVCPCARIGDLLGRLADAMAPDTRSKGRDRDPRGRGKPRHLAGGTRAERPLGRAPGAHEATLGSQGMQMRLQ